MNILRHKKWHVRTKENVARVRRDEAKAAEEERARAERAALADNEDRVRRLKARAGVAASVASASDIFGGVSAPSATASSSAATMAPPAEVPKHVNLFAELEEQERTNTVVGNREYAAERKKEQDDWESKVGIMKRFAEDTKEYAKESEWWEGIPLVREKVDKRQSGDGGDKAATKTMTKDKPKKFVTEEEKSALRKERKKQRKKQKKRDKAKKKKRRRRHSSSSASSSSSSDSEAAERKKTKLDELRMERMVRERQEQTKTKQLFVKPEPKEEAAPATVKSQVEEDRQRRYNTQFNPTLARS